MKVICLEDFPIQLGAEGEYPAPSVGEECTVIDQITYMGYKVYELAEYPPVNGRALYFDVEGFAPVSDIDERERLEEWKASRLTETDKMLQLCADMWPEVEMPPLVFERVWRGIVLKMEGAL